MFTSIGEILEGKKTGKKVQLRGWVYRIRGSNKMVFAVLRDSSGTIQCTIKREKSDPIFVEAKKATIESSVTLTGKVNEDKRAPGGYEIDVDNFEIVGLAEPFPIEGGQSDEFLLDMRHLWIRSRNTNATFKIRSSSFGAIHEYFRKEGFLETHPPMFVSGAVEGGSTLFEVPYFGRKAYLSQSWQLYAEAMITTVEKLYTVAPSFRAEKSRTRKHLTEFWHAEVEAAWWELEDMMKLGEGILSHMCQTVAKNNPKELEALGRDPKDLKLVKPPFKRIRYDEAVDIINKRGLKMEWGDDLGVEHERKIVEGEKKPIFVTHYPTKIKPFYHKFDPDDHDHVLCFDCIAPEGYGEIIGGGQREDNQDLLIERMKAEGVDPKSYGWYLDLRKYGSVPHSGFGLGTDRVITWLGKLEHIRDAIPFPRTINRIYP
ncbi:asparagine--tRNA ligase [Candidatus Undinarchaeota archaeon]